jgi:hypothetical protein
VIPTSITGGGQEISLYCDTTFPFFDSWFFAINVNLAAAASGPAPSGTLTIFDNANLYPGWDFSVNSFGPYGVVDGFNSGAPYGDTFLVSWFASYTGDANYQPSTGSGTFSITSCPWPSGAALANSIGKNAAPQIRLPLIPVGAVPSHPAMPKPKFSLSPPTESMGSAIAPHWDTQGSSCIKTRRRSR